VNPIGATRVLRIPACFLRRGGDKEGLGDGRRKKGEREGVRAGDEGRCHRQIFGRETLSDLTAKSNAIEIKRGLQVLYAGETSCSESHSRGRLRETGEREWGEASLFQGN
jgi:hypothetical protein